MKERFVRCIDCKHEADKGLACKFPLHCEYKGTIYYYKVFYGDSMKWNPEGKCGRYKQKWWKTEWK